MSSPDAVNGAVGPYLVPFPRKRHRPGGAISPETALPRGCHFRGIGCGDDREVPAPVVITDPHDPRVDDFRNLKAGDRPEGTPRWGGPVIVEGVPAVERLLATDYRIRAVFGVPGRVAALDLPDDVAAYEADKWLLSEVIGFRLTRGVLASADRRPPADLDQLLAGPDPAAPRRLAVLEALT